MRGRQVKEAIPIPLDGLQQIIQGARASPLPGALPTTEGLLEGCASINRSTIVGRSRGRTKTPCSFFRMEHKT